MREREREKRKEQNRNGTIKLGKKSRTIYEAYVQYQLLWTHEHDDCSKSISVHCKGQNERRNQKKAKEQHEE